MLQPKSFCIDNGINCSLREVIMGIVVVVAVGYVTEDILRQDYFLLKINFFHDEHESAPFI